MSNVVDFTHLHCHTEFSQLDGMPKIEEYRIKCAEMGYDALAITEHGNLRSIYQHNLRASGKFEHQGETYDLPPINPIFGIEFYLSHVPLEQKGLDQSIKDEIRRKFSAGGSRKEALKQAEKEHKVRRIYHLLAFAKNKIGLLNLFKLSHISWAKGFYYKPRIDSELLFKLHEGIIISTACVSGLVPESLVQDDWESADKWMKRAKKVFKDDFYMEIMPHTFDDQYKANERLIQMADEHKVKIIATNDCHYLEPDDALSHEVLLAINTGRRDLKDDEGLSFDMRGFHFRTKDEMFNAFMAVPQLKSLGVARIESALQTTREIVDKCDVRLNVDRKQGILPKIFVPDGFDSINKYLVHLCKTGWTWRKIDERISRYSKANNISEEKARQIYKDRLEFELKRIFKMRFARYFLMIQEIMKWAREQEIMVGPGRGSSAASLVCFLIGITSIDPIEYDLLFDRFLNENRVDYPDIDLDFQDTRRDEVYKYLFDKYGEENCCQITTMVRMKGKAALLDVGRVIGVPMARTHAVNKHIVERSSGDARASQTVEDSFKEFDVCRQYNEEFPEVLQHVKKIEGRVRNVGVHAAGIQIADRPIDTICPVEYRKGKDGTYSVKVSALDWLECQGLGLIKIDILGLKTLSILKSALDQIKERHGVSLDLETLDLEDSKVLEGFTKGYFTGIFQFDSIGMSKTCEKLTFRSFNDIAALNALYRPGAMRSGLANHYINRSIGEEEIESLHPVYDDITKRTYGVLVYQEQFIRCFVDLAGYDPGTGDELRKAVAKKYGVETIGKEEDHFVNGAVANGLDEKKAKELFKNMAFFGCLTGDTLVHRASANQHQKEQISLKDLYEYQEKPYNNLLYKKLKLKCLIEDEDRVKIGNMIKVVKTGVKRVYLVKTASGKTSRSTMEHGYKTPEDWKRLKELSIGDLICVTDFKKPSSASGLGKGGRAKGKTYEGYGLKPGKGNINYVHGQTGVDVQKKKEFIERYGNKCQECDSKRFVELHHKDFDHYNNDDSNLVLLCRKCHRDKHRHQLSRYTVGYSIRYEEIMEITYLGEEECYDIMMEGPNNNFVINDGIVVHNSYAFNLAHAAAYGVIAYWGMFLKVYYATEFFYALMKHEIDQDQIAHFTKEARKLGIEVLMPDINSSKLHFSIEAGNTIRCGLMDIKGVGQKASKEIVDKQPYSGLINLSNKVDRKKVNRGVLKALVKAGSFKSLYPNTGAMIKELEIVKKSGKKERRAVWDVMLDKKTDEIATALYSEHDTSENTLSEEQMITLQSFVCPIPPPKHKVEYYPSIERLVRPTKIAHIDWETDEDVVLMGTLVDIKYNNIGDFHKGDPPPEAERKKQRWGARYANVNIEDETGLHRMKIDVDEFPAFRHIIDKGLGTPVLVKARVHGKSQGLFTVDMVDLDEMRDILDGPGDIKDKYKRMDNFQRYFLLHPTKTLKKKEKFANLNTIANGRYGTFKIVGLVIRIKPWYTKKDDLMYFMDVEDNTGALNMIVWPELVKKHRAILRQGNVITGYVKRNNSGTYLEPGAALKKTCWKLRVKSDG